MRDLGKLCLASLCLLVTVALLIAPVNADVIFEETFDAMGEAGDGIDTAVWLPGLNDGVDSVTRLVDLGGGDWALYTEGWDIGGPTRRFNGIRSVQSFERGNNLRVTFTMFGNPFIAPQGEPYPKACGPFGPWHLTNDWYSHGEPWHGRMDRTIEVGLTYWPGWKYHWEEAGAPGPNDATGPLLRQDNGFRSAVLNSPVSNEDNLATQKAQGSVKMRFYVGDTSGGTMEYSLDNGVTWLPIIAESDGSVIDTRGDSTEATVCTPPLPSGETVGACTPLYLGLGSLKHAVFDDIIVETGVVVIETVSNIPGDCNQDGAFDLSDVIHLLGFLFQGNPESLPCSTEEANLALMDCNQDGGIDLSDAVYKLAFLFQGSPPPVQGEGCIEIADCPQNPDCP